MDKGYNTVSAALYGKDRNAILSKQFICCGGLVFTDLNEANEGIIKVEARALGHAPTEIYKDRVVGCVKVYSARLKGLGKDELTVNVHINNTVIRCVKSDRTPLINLDKSAVFGGVNMIVGREIILVSVRGLLSIDATENRSVTCRPPAACAVTRGL